jgi:hypothetical protein
LDTSDGKGSEAAGDRRICLCRWQAPDPDLLEVPFVALDLETTGARTGTSKITEIGAVRIEGLREVATFHTLVNPMRPIPRMITEITGITQDMVAAAPRIDQVIPDLLEFLRGAVIVAHNAGFDVGFLNYELRRLKGTDWVTARLTLCRWHALWHRGCSTTNWPRWRKPWEPRWPPAIEPWPMRRRRRTCSSRWWVACASRGSPG